MKKTIILAVISLYANFLAAQGNEEELRLKANTAFEAGLYLDAHPLYSQLVSLHPKNEDYNWRFGACTIFAGSDYETAIKHLRFASQRTTVDPRAYYYLGLAFQLNYEFDPAVKAYNNFINLGDAKLKAEFDVNRRIEQCKNGKGLLSQVKDLVVLDKTAAGDDDFFRFFNLDGMGGRILAMPEDLKTKEDKKHKGINVIYYPSNSTVIYYSSYGKDAANGKDIYRSFILPGGKFSEPEILKGGVNTKYHEDFAFMHPDGKTFYFASKGHNSMGGYDIFKCMYDEAKDTFSPAVNLDFAVNTPDDDILFVTDSLQRVACFASGRSSAMGELHVYKVRVEGIPVQIVFIQGEFISEIAPDSKKAKIQVFDELTGRPVESTFSSVSSGDYVLSLPKSGRYRIEVEGDQSPIVHEGIIDIPVFQEPVALRQQLKLIKENGVEKLIINNFFDEPLMDRIAELSASLMRKKAGLDVNVSDELLAQLDEEDKLTIELNAENAPQIAGFVNGTTLQNIQSDLSSEETNLKTQAEQSKAKIDYALGYADDEESTGNQLLQKAEVIKAKANPDRKDIWIDEMVKYQNMVMQAEKHFVNAQNAYEVANKLEEKSSQLEARAKETNALNKELTASNSAADYNKMVDQLTAIKNRKNINSDDLKALAEEAREQSRKSESENLASLERLTKLRDDERSLQNQLKARERQMATASKKEKENLSVEISSFSTDLEILQEKIAKESTRAEDSENKRNDYASQANIYENIVLKTTPNLASGPIKMSSAERDQRSGAVIASISKAREMQIRDEATLSLIGPGLRVTSDELITEEQKTQNASTQVALKSLDDITSYYKVALTNIPPGLQSRENAYRMSVLSASTLTQLNDKEKQLMQMRKAPGADMASIDKELSSLSASREEIRSNSAENVQAADQASVAAQMTKLGAISPLTLKGMEWEKSMNSIALNQSVISTARERKVQIDTELLNEKDPSRIKVLSEDGIALTQIIKNSTSDQQTFNDVKSSFNSAVTSEKENAKKMNMIDAYINQLNASSAHLEKQSAKMNPDDSMRAFNLNAEINKEINRVSTLKESMSLPGDQTLASAGSDPKPDPKNQITENQNPALVNNSQSNDASVQKSNPALKSDPQALKGKLLPKEKVQIIRALVSDYPLEMVNKSGAGVIPDIDRAKYESALLTGLNAEIKNRETTLVSTTDSTNAGQLENDLNVLRTLKRQTELRSMELKNVKDNTSKPIVLNTLTTEQKSILEYVLEPLPESDAKQAYESPVFDDLIANNQDVNLEIRNLGAIIETHAEIASKEQEIQTLTDAGKQKKLDRQVESLYVRVGEMEIGNSAKLRQMAEIRFDENKQKIDNLESAKSDLLIANNELDLQFEQNGSKAEIAMKDAEQIRQNAERITDPIEKNYRLREAFSLESEAIQYQEQSIALLENIEMITASHTQYLATLEAEASAEEVSKTLNSETVETETSETSETENNQASINSTDTQVKDPVATQTENQNKNDTETTDPLAERTTGPGTEKPVPAPTGMRPQVGDRSAGININVLSADRLLDQASDAGNQDPNVRAQIEKSADFKQYTSMLNETLNAQNKLKLSLDERAALLEELQSIEAKIEVLEKTLDSTSSEAEAEGIREEIRKLRAQADVLYSRINMIDRDIDSQEKLLAKLAADLQTKSSNITSMAVKIASSNEKPASVGAAIAAEDRFWIFPEVLTEDFFAMMNGTPYSANRPIPIDPALPEGLIYKVQIGAFKNAIPQDLFGGFAPLSGESAGNGLTRYTAGMFLEFDNADDAKKQIREMGYSDAFVVAFYNGKRIPIYEAMAIAGKGSDSIAQNLGKPTSNNQNTNQPTANEIRNAQNNANGNTNNANPVENSIFNPNKESVSYYANEVGAAEANQVEVMKGLFYSVQVGVYSKPVPAADLFNISPLNSEKLNDGKVRYTTGVYNNLQEAASRKETVRSNGITDAFVTAYYNGKRITIQKAAEIFAQYGPEALAVSNALSDANADAEFNYVVQIGTFKDQVPADAAKAMLYLEDSRGVTRKESKGETSYFTRPVNSMETAKIIKQEFESYGLENVTIIKLRKGEEPGNSPR